MIKQTQTKLFDFSDVGLDFCTGSKNKFPEVFKKMLAVGFNPQAANSVSISGSQITFTYGVNHGYVADRVLLVTATGGFNKEVYIDSVTSNTVTCTVLDNVTTGLTGTINTRVASIGWDIVYEVGNIHVYKMKHIDDTDRYVRLCFQNQASLVNAIAVCIGKTWDSETGFIDDPYAFQEAKDVMTPLGSGWKAVWHNTDATSSHNSWTYSQGFANYGKGMVVGSPYHFCFNMTAQLGHSIYGIFPQVSHSYPRLDYPIVISKYINGSSLISSNGNFSSTSGIGVAFIGEIICRFDKISVGEASLFKSDTNDFLVSSFLPNTLDGSNTATIAPLEIYHRETSQHLGYVYGIGLCLCRFNDAPTYQKDINPSIGYDVDFNNMIVVMKSITYGYSHSQRIITIPVEEIKHGV